MSSQNTDQNLELKPSAELSNHAHGSELLTPSLPPQSNSRRFLVPLILGLLVLGGVGWVLFNRVILPILMFSNMAPPPPLAVPLGQAKVTTVEESSDYAATLDSRQSVTLQPKVPGQISTIFEGGRSRPGRRYSAANGRRSAACPGCQSRRWGEYRSG